MDGERLVAGTQPQSGFGSRRLQPHHGPVQKYDMVFNGAAPTRGTTTSPGRYSGEDNGWTAALFSQALLEFDQSIMKYPNIKRFPGGASNDLIPDLQHPNNPVPALDPNHMPKTVPSAD